MKKHKNKSKLKGKNSSKSMNNKVKRSMRRRSRNKFKELLKKSNGVINMKEWMKMNHYGLETDNKSKIKNTKISIRLYSRKLLILQLGVISKLKVMLNLLDCCLSLRGLISINLINSMKKNPKLSSLLEEFLSMINSKNYSQNISISWRV